MHRDRVASSSIASVGYDAASQTLEIEFVSGATYRYRDVTPDVFDQLMRAESKGRYVNARVRSDYSFTRVA